MSAPRRSFFAVLATLLAAIAAACVYAATWTVEGWTTPQRLLATGVLTFICALLVSVGTLS